MPRKGGLGQIQSGDWDQNNLKKITQNRKVRGFEQRFAEQKDWEETVYYDFLTERSDEELKSKGFEEIDDFIQYCFQEYDELYDRIKKEGYKKNHAGPSKWRNRDLYSMTVRDTLEVLVTIGRCGEIYLTGGLHRFGIARALDIKIPVQVVVRHKQWQELRDDIYNNGLPKEHKDLRDHPDLQDIHN